MGGSEQATADHQSASKAFVEIDVADALAVLGNDRVPQLRFQLGHGHGAESQKQRAGCGRGEAAWEMLIWWRMGGRSPSLREERAGSRHHEDEAAGARRRGGGRSEAKSAEGVTV